MSFCDIEISEVNFHYSKQPADINRLNIDIISMPKKLSFNRKGFKYFGGYKGHNKINGGYAKTSVETKYMFFLLKMVGW